MTPAHVPEKQERTQWTKRQQIVHGYGNHKEELRPEEEKVVDSDYDIRFTLSTSLV